MASLNSDYNHHQFKFEIKCDNCGERHEVSIHFVGSAHEVNVSTRSAHEIKIEEMKK